MQLPQYDIQRNKKKILIGLEFENNLIYTKTGLPIERQDIKKLWGALIKTGTYAPLYDRHTQALIGVTHTTKAGIIVINTDTGVCNLELAMPPGTDLHKTLSAWRKEFRTIISHAKKLGFTAIGAGITPRTLPRNPASYKTEKSLYRVVPGMRIPRWNIMVPISAHQVCIDVPLKQNIALTRSLTKLSGLFVALSANSMLADDTIQAWKEIRSVFYAVPFFGDFIHGERIFGFPKKEFFSLEEYLKEIWSATLLTLVTDDGRWTCIDDPKVTVWKYLHNGKTYKGSTADGTPILLQATVNDINQLMHFAWHDVKPHILIDTKKITLPDFLNALHNNTLEQYLEKKVIASYIEIRMCPSAPKKEEGAMPALFLGLVANMKKTIAFAECIPFRDAEKLKMRSSIDGLDTHYHGVASTHYLTTLLNIAEEGLKKRGLHEEKYLKPLRSRIAQKRTPADVTKKNFQHMGLQKSIARYSY